MERLKAIWSLIHNDRVLKVLGLIGVIVGTNKNAIAATFPEIAPHLDNVLWILVALGLYNHTIPLTSTQAKATNPAVPPGT